MRTAASLTFLPIVCSNESYLAISSIVGLANAYPELNSYYEGILTEEGKRGFELARTQCNTQLAENLSNVNISTFFTTGASFQNSSVAQRYIEGGLLGQPLNDTGLTPVSVTGVLPIPVFQYHVRPFLRERSLPSAADRRFPPLLASLHRA